MLVLDLERRQPQIENSVTGVLNFSKIHEFYEFFLNSVIGYSVKFSPTLLIVIFVS